MAGRLGANILVNFKNGDPVEQIIEANHGRGVDASIEALGTQDTGSSSGDIANTQHLASLAVDSRPDAGEAPLPAGAATPLPSSPSTSEA